MYPHVGLFEGGYFAPRDVYFNTLKSEKILRTETSLTLLERGYRSLAHLDETRNPYRSLGARILATDLHEALYKIEPDLAHLRAVSFLANKLRDEPEDYDSTDPLSKLGALYVAHADESLLSVWVARSLRETSQDAIEALKRPEPSPDVSYSPRPIVPLPSPASAASVRPANLFEIMNQFGLVEEGIDRDFKEPERKEEPAKPNVKGIDEERILALAIASADEERVRLREKENETFLAFVNEYVLPLHSEAVNLFYLENTKRSEAQKRLNDLFDQRDKIFKRNVSSQKAQASTNQLQIKVVQKIIAQLRSNLEEENSFVQKFIAVRSAIERASKLKPKNSSSLSLNDTIRIKDSEGNNESLRFIIMQLFEIIPQKIEDFIRDTTTDQVFLLDLIRQQTVILNDLTFFDTLD